MRILGITIVFLSTLQLAISNNNTLTNNFHSIISSTNKFLRQLSSGMKATNLIGV